MNNAMSKHSTTVPSASAFMHKLWQAEAQHPVFAGSLNNVNLIVTFKDQKSPKGRKKTKLSGTRLHLDQKLMKSK
jgi:hypothetical protein